MSMFNILTDPLGAVIRSAAPFTLSMALLFASVHPLDTAQQRQELPLKSRGASKLTRLRPQELKLSTVRPSNVKRIPPGLIAPYYTTIQLGPKEQPSQFTVLIDAPSGKPSQIYVDANGNGDMLDDPRPEWTHKTYEDRGSTNLLQSVGGATVQVKYGAKTLPLHVTLSRYDTSEPAREPAFLPIYCTADYAREGAVTLSGKSYHAWLVDALTRGDFRGSGVRGQSGIFLLIDVNANGKIDARGETYEAYEPFNIGGVTYEIQNIDVTGGSFDIVKSSRQVAEILPPPDLGIGKVAPAFQAAATTGSTVQFPRDYHSKLVLLYFWATWCGDCNRDVPYVVKAYKEFHPRGLDILGVSLDHPDQAEQLKSYTKEHEMDWKEIYDGKVWNAAIAQLYFISETPTALLIDGDKGTVLASGSDLRGDNLAPTIEKHISLAHRSIP
jgi:thiol-disulfide isomerase/thioredoxin